MDKIQITITRNCDSQGVGGTVVDDASAVLGAMPDGVPILDALVAAFADAYGLHQVEVDGELQPVSGYRNLAYRCRQYMTEIVLAYAAKTAAQAAQQQAQAAVAQALGSVQIVESTPQQQGSVET
jgi:hypothetical protein